MAEYDGDIGTRNGRTHLFEFVLCVAFVSDYFCPQDIFFVVEFQRSLRNELFFVIKIIKYKIVYFAFVRSSARIYTWRAATMIRKPLRKKNAHMTIIYIKGLISFLY